MITRIQVLNYKSLKYIDINLKPFVLLVGANATGKSTFLDIFNLLHDILTKDCVYAVEKRCSNFSELVWKHQKSNFEIAVELKLPEEKADKFSMARYEISICYDETKGIFIDKENLFLIKKEIQMEHTSRQYEMFPKECVSPEHIVSTFAKRTIGWEKIISRSPEGKDYFNSETKKWNFTFQFGSDKSSLANVPADETRFPSAIWVKKILTEGIQFLQLNSIAMRWPCRADAPIDLQMDGSNLPKVINFLKEKYPDYFERWLEHVKSALPEINNIGVSRRPEDRSLYIYITYRDNLEVSSWLLSDGTLRLLAHTLIAYLPVKDRIYIIEEPENGLHPLAIESVYQSISSVYDNQILLATHSPAILNLCKAGDILCFSKTETGAVDIIWGDEHPNLKDWQEDVDLSTLHASGVLQ
jgi:predicted ATPase